MITEAQAAQLAVLLDESSCRSLLERYTYAIDWLDWTALEALFWEDAELDFDTWQGDRAAFIPWVTALEEPYLRRLHMFAAPRIELLGTTEARMEAGSVVLVRSAAPEGEAAGIGTDTLVLVRYQFHVQKRGDEWRLSMLRFIPYGSQSFPGDAAGSADHLTMTHPWFAQ